MLMNDFWENQLESGYYDKILTKGKQKNSGIQSNWHNLTFQKISAYLKKEDVHIDYACGPGSFIGLYSISKSIGLDISMKQINYAKKVYGEKADFFHVDTFDYEKFEKKVDLITVIGLLEFMNEQDSVKLINKLKLLLKPNGKMILTTPNYGGFMNILEKLVNLFGNVNYANQHINRLSKSKAKNLINMSKFMNFSVYKIINIGIGFSIISHQIGTFFEKLIEKLFNNFFGFILLIELKNDQ